MAKEPTKKPTAEPTTFFNLPVEVRLQVYRLVLPEAVTVLFDSYGNEQSQDFHRTLRLTCKNANKDLWSCLRPHITVVFLGFDELKGRMQRMSTSFRDQISRVIVVIKTKLRWRFPDPASMRYRPGPRRIKETKEMTEARESRTSTAREYFKELPSGKCFLYDSEGQLRMAIGFNIAGPDSVNAYEGCTDTISLARLRKWRPWIPGTRNRKRNLLSSH